ncbi:hypothetical protein Hanom_Chr17g01582951 [Helianthus anomalus]
MNDQEYEKVESVAEVNAHGEKGARLHGEVRSEEIGGGQNVNSKGVGPDVETSTGLPRMDQVGHFNVGSNPTSSASNNSRPKKRPRGLRSPWRI